MSKPAAVPTESRSTLLGILILTASTFIFAVQDAITKELTTAVPVVQIVFVRFVAFSLLALILAGYRTGLGQAIRSAVPGLQIGRVLIMCFEIGLFAYGIRFLGLAEIHTVMACFPLIITALSVPMLGESVGWRRWLAVSIGFVGTLVILQPGREGFNPFALIPLACAFMYAVYNLITRRVSKHDSFDTSLLYFGLVGLVASGCLIGFYWTPVAGRTAWLLLAICISSMVAHLMLIKALELAAAAVLQPFNYLILVWAILLGYLLYDEVLQPVEILGASIVVASGVYIGYREYALARAAHGNGDA